MEGSEAPVIRWMAARRRCVTDDMFPGTGPVESAVHDHPEPARIGWIQISANAVTVTAEPAGVSASGAGTSSAARKQLPEAHHRISAIVGLARPD